jgi:hypothetical protein
VSIPESNSDSGVTDSGITAVNFGGFGAGSVCDLSFGNLAQPNIGTSPIHDVSPNARWDEGGTHLQVRFAEQVGEERWAVLEMVGVHIGAGATVTLQPSDVFSPKPGSAVLTIGDPLDSNGIIEFTAASGQVTFSKADSEHLELTLTSVPMAPSRSIAAGSFNVTVTCKFTSSG